MRKHQRGNALWFILLAVFLLGALTVLLNRGSSNTEETGDVEKARIEASKLLTYTSSIQIAIQRMLSNGISENEISFGNDVFQACDDTPIQPVGQNTLCTKPECEVFNVGGGGIKAKYPSEAILESSACPTYWKWGTMAASVQNFVNIGTPANDLGLEVFGLTRAACVEINRLVGIDNPGGDPPVEDDEPGATYTWEGNYAPATGTIGNDASEIEGKKHFCMERQGQGTYHFWTVLIAR